MSGMIRCPRCNNILGQVLAGLVVIKHKRREAAVREVVSIRCEKCGATWRPREVEAPAA